MSWLAGGIVAVVILVLGPPGILPAYSYPGFIDLTDVLGLAEPGAMIASTVFAVERFIRRCGTRWQFSLRELLISVTTCCLVIAVTADQYRQAQRLDVMNAKDSFVDFVYPSLVVAPWFLRLPLYFGVVCLAYAVVKSVLYAIRKVMWCLTLNWKHDEDPNAPATRQ